MKTFTALILVIGLAACSPDEKPTKPSIATPTAMPTAVPALPGEVMATATILDSGKGPELCVGGVAESLPPQCSGPPIRDWDWSDQEHASASGTRWGSYTVVGTFDGRSFTFLRMADAPEPRGDEMDFSTPCKEPAGGWPSARHAEPDTSSVFERASRLPNFGGAWLDGTIVNVRYTKNLEAAERAIRTFWDGPLCVTKAERTEAERHRIQDELTRLPGVTSAGSNVVTEQVEISVIADDGSFQAWADAEYGEGLVEIQSALRPLN